MRTGSLFFCCLLLTAYCLLLLGLNSCATAPSAKEQKEADYNYKMGEAFLSEGKLQEAFVRLQKTLQLDPVNKDALLKLGLIHMQFEEFEKAKSLFLRAISIDPLFSDAQTYLGIAYIRMRQWQEAIEPLKKALSNVLYQTPDRAYYYLGIAYYRLGQFDNAIAAFKDSIKRAPSAPYAYYSLSLAYNKTGRYGDAAAVIEQAIEIDSAFGGDKEKFISEIKRKMLTTEGEDEADARDFLEIMQY